MRSFLILLTFFGAFYNSFGQAPAQNVGSIDGVVLDSISKEPIEYAQVALLKSQDSSVVASIYTGEGGAFVMEQLPLGKYIVKVSNLGFKTKFIPNITLSMQKPLRKLGNVSLVSDEAVIEEIEVFRDKTAIQIGLDKKVYNVGDDISVSGGSAQDVLNNVPSVEIDQIIHRSCAPEIGTCV